MEEISNEEFMGWSNYFERQPDGWREDLRAYYIMTSMSGSKSKPEQIFPSIAQLKKSEEAYVDKGKANTDKFKQSAFGMMFANAMHSAGKEVEGLNDGKHKD